MKKILICLCSMVVGLTFSGCSEGNAKESSKSSDSCYEYTFESVDELADSIITNKDSNYQALFSHPTQKNNSSELVIYTLNNIPDNYKLYEIREYGNFISMDYYTEDPLSGSNVNEYSYEKNISEESEMSLSSAAEFESSDGGIENNKSQVSQITFVWGFNTDGDVYLPGAVKSFGLTEMKELPGFYYSEAMNEYGEQIYQIYWSEDGYCFQVNLPVNLLDEVGSYITDTKANKSGYSIDLNKTAYSLEN